MELSTPKTLRSEADYSAVRSVGVDETSKARGHNYISVFMDLAPEWRRVLCVTEDREADAVGRFAEDLKARGFRLFQYRETAIYLTAGKLDVSPQAVVRATHTK